MGLFEASSPRRQANSSALDNYGLRSGEIEVFPHGQKVTNEEGKTLSAKDSLALQESSLVALDRHEQDTTGDVFLDDSTDAMEENDRAMDSNNNNGGKRRRKVLAMAFLLTMVLLAIILGTVLTSSQYRQNHGMEPKVASGAQMADTEVTPAPSLAPTSVLESTSEYQILKPYVNPPSLLLDPQTPQGKAFTQILSEQIKDDPEFRVRQRFAMMATYYAMGGENWTWQTGWNEFSEDECDWHGVAICRYQDGRKIAAGLRIASNNAVGTLPQEICLLDGLETLVVEGNELSGSLPACLTSLVSVFEFNLRKNEFTGSPPSGFLSMPRLETLDLSSNQFTGGLDFLAESGTSNSTSVSRLMTLRLASNDFSGTLPSEVYALDSLQELTLQETMLTGDISAICDNTGIWIVTANCSLASCNSDCCECM